MPIVLVHGVPDTTEVWDPFLAALSALDVDTSEITLATLPGFDTPAPDGFGSTMDELVDEVIAQIAALGAPVDVVGHDWGAMFTQRIATTRPELVRSYVMSNGGVNAEFTWHDLAVAWQTPEVGEQVMEMMAGAPLADALRDGGHPDASAAADRVDAAMKDSVLKLYRSAVDIVGEWLPAAPAERPGLVLWGEHDPYGPLESGRRTAATMGATFSPLAGGHWVIVERADDAAAAVTDFWATLPSP